MATLPHPLRQLSIEETNIARDVVLSLHEGVVIEFREIFLQEPPKAELIKFLELEHSGQVSGQTARPARLAKVQYDVIGGSKLPVFHESIVDIPRKERVAHEIVKSDYHAALTV